MRGGALIAGAVAICVAAALWGVDGVMLTPNLYGLSIPFVVFLLHAVPFALMQPFLFRSYAELARLDRAGWLALLLVAATGGILGTLAIVKALFLVQFNHLSVVVLLQKLQPVFALLLAFLLLKERLTPRFLAWAVLALFGAYLVAFGISTPHTAGTPWAAAAWAVVAAASFGAATVFGKRLLGTMPFTTATFGRFGVTALLSAAYLLVAGIGFPFSSVSGKEWLIIILIGVTTGSGAIFLYYWGLARVPASLSTLCELCMPASALIVDYAVNGTLLSPFQLLGAAALFVAVWRATIEKRTAVTHARRSGSA